MSAEKLQVVERLVDRLLREGKPKMETVYEAVHAAVSKHNNCEEVAAIKKAIDTYVCTVISFEDALWKLEALSKLQSELEKQTLRHALMGDSVQCLSEERAEQELRSGTLRLKRRKVIEQEAVEETAEHVGNIISMSCAKGDTEDSSASGSGGLAVTVKDEEETLEFESVPPSQETKSISDPSESTLGGTEPM